MPLFRFPNIFTYTMIRYLGDETKVLTQDSVMFHRHFILFIHSLRVIPNYILLGHLQFDWVPYMMSGVKFSSLMLRDSDLGIIDSQPVQVHYWASDARTHSGMWYRFCGCHIGEKHRRNCV